MKENIKAQFIIGFQWNFVGQLLTYAIKFVLGIIIARLLTPEDYGLIGMLGIFMSISQSFVDSGFGNALIRKDNRTETDFSTVFYFNVAVSLILYLILFVSAPYIALFFHQPILTSITRVLSLIIVVNSIGIVPRAILSIAVDFKSQALASVVSTIVSCIIGLYLAYTGFGVWALVWQAIIAPFVNVTVVWLFARWFPLRAYSWQSFKTMFSYGSKLLASSLINTIYRHASSLIIGKVYSPAELGNYDRGYQIASIPSLRLVEILCGVTFPVLSKIQNDETRLVNVYHKYLVLSSIVIFFTMTLLAMVAEPLVLSLFTEKWIGTVPFLRIFCFAFMFDCVCRLNNNIMYVKGRSELFLKLEVIKKVAVIPFFIFAIPHGTIAICFVAVVHTFVDIVFSTYYIKLIFGVKLRQYIPIVKYLLLSILACLPSYFISKLSFPSWISLLFGVLVSLVLYVFFLHKDVNMKEGLSILLNMVKKKR